MKFLRRFLRRWRKHARARAYLRRWADIIGAPLPVPPDETTPWTRDDAAALLAFAGGVTGQRLILRLRQWDHATAYSACNQPQPNGRDFAAGYAAGTRATVALVIVELSQPPREEEEPANTPPPGAERLRARLSP